MMECLNKETQSCITGGPGFNGFCVFTHTGIEKYLFLFHLCLTSFQMLRTFINKWQEYIFNDASSAGACTHILAHMKTSHFYFKGRVHFASLIKVPPVFNRLLDT